MISLQLDPDQDASDCTRPLHPIGSPIEVETNYTDRLPSVDSPEHIIRDSDAIIVMEIKCQGSADESSTEINTLEPEEDQISDVLEDEIEDISDEHIKKERRRGENHPIAEEEMYFPTNSLCFYFSQAQGSAHMGKIRSFDRDDNVIQRKGYNKRKDVGRRHTSAKGEKSYAHKGWEHNHSNRLHRKTDGIDRQRESDNSERALRKSDQGLRGRRTRIEDMGKREHVVDEMTFYGNRDSSSRRKRERDDDVYAVRYKEEGLFQRERGGRQRDRDEWHRVKHPSEDVMSRMNNIRSAEEKAWSSHSRLKDEYRGSARDYYQKDVTQHNQQPRRSEWTENERFVQHRGREDIHMYGNQHRSDGRRPRRDRVSTRDDRYVNAYDSHRVHEGKRKEYPWKGKEYEGGYPNSVPHSAKNQNKRRGLKTGSVCSYLGGVTRERALQPWRIGLSCLENKQI